MAELVRQVTSSCAEQGRVLAATWNLHVGLTDALTGALAMVTTSEPALAVNRMVSSIHQVCRQGSFMSPFAACQSAWPLTDCSGHNV